MGRRKFWKVRGGFSDANGYRRRGLRGKTLATVACARPRNLISLSPFSLVGRVAFLREPVPGTFHMQLDMRQLVPVACSWRECHDVANPCTYWD